MVRVMKLAQRGRPKKKQEVQEIKEAVDEDLEEDFEDNYEPNNPKEPTMKNRIEVKAILLEVSEHMDGTVRWDFPKPIGSWTLLGILDNIKDHILRQMDEE